MGILGNSKLKSGVFLVGGTAGGQILLFLTSIITVRFFTPSEIGQFATISAIAVCLVSLATGKYEMAIPLPKSDADSLTIARLAIALGSIFGVVLVLAVLLLRGIGAQGTFNDVLSYGWALPALTWSLALFQIANSVAVRSEIYTSIARRAVIYPLVTGSLQILAGMFSAGSAGLILSLVAGQLTAFLALWLPARKLLTSSGGRSRSWLALAKRYRRFPAFLSLSGALNAVSLQLPLVLLTIYFGLYASGQYAIALKIAALPVVLVSQSIGYLYAGELSRRHRDGSAGILGLYLRSSRQLGLFALLVGLVMYVASPTVFPLVLGDDWKPAGDFAQIGALAIVGQIFAAPLSQTLAVAKMPFTQFAIDGIRVAAILASGLFAAAASWSAESAVLFMSSIIFITYIILWGFNCYAAKRLDSGSVRP